MKNPGDRCQQHLPGFYPSVAQPSCGFSLGPDQLSRRAERDRSPHSQRLPHATSVAASAPPARTRKLRNP